MRHGGNWATGCTPPGFIVDNNPIESFNGQIKKIVTNNEVTNTNILIQNLIKFLQYECKIKTFKDTVDYTRKEYIQSQFYMNSKEFLNMIMMNDGTFIIPTEDILLQPNYNSLFKITLKK